MVYKQMPTPLVGYKVLLVDDEPDNLMVAQILLEIAGATVQTADNGQAALNLLEESTPSFIITDLSMPIIDGWAVLASLRAGEKWKNIVCFALTAHAMPSDRERVYEAGFNGYLTKPLDPATFVDDIVGQLRKFPPLEAELAADIGKDGSNAAESTSHGG